MKLARQPIEAGNWLDRWVKIPGGMCAQLGVHMPTVD